MHTLVAVSTDRQSTRPARRGRPKVEDDPGERDRHIACACRRLLRSESLETVADRFAVSPRTVQLWVDKALRYDHPMSRILAAMVAQSN